MTSIQEKRSLLRRQFRDFMETAKEIMVMLDAETAAMHDCPIKNIGVIQRVVAEAHGQSVLVFASRTRTEAYAYCRHVAMVICRELTQHTCKDIGRCFGGRDHGTVNHATLKISNLLATDPAFVAKYQTIRAKCENALLESSMPLFESKTP